MSFALFVFYFILFSNAQPPPLPKCKRRTYEENNVCKECPSGYYCPDGERLIECPKNHYSEESSFYCHECGCQNEGSCRKRTIRNNITNEIISYAGSCESESACLPGFGFNKTTKQCRKCMKGSYSKGGTNECITCKEHFISINESECVECPFGQEVFLNRCQLCASHKRYNKKTYKCELCEAGKYQNPKDVTKCKSCPRGYKYLFDKCVTKQEFKRFFYRIGSLYNY